MIFKTLVSLNEIRFSRETQYLLRIATTISSKLGAPSMAKDRIKSMHPKGRVSRKGRRRLSEKDHAQTRSWARMTIR
jgi:hypothetical protein